jgi:hypothetical protein
VDRVIKDYREVPLDFPGGDGKKTLGQAEHSFVLWRKRYIIIPGAAARVPSPPPQLPLDRWDESERNSFSIIILNYWLLV